MNRSIFPFRSHHNSHIMSAVAEMLVEDEAISTNFSAPVVSFCTSFLNDLNAEVASFNNNLTSNTDFDVDAFLECYLGPKLQPYKFLIPITVVYCFMFVTGIVGNVLGKDKVGNFSCSI